VGALAFSTLGCGRGAFYSFVVDDGVCDRGEECSSLVTLERSVDILFVIDNSGSMGEEQGTLAKNFASFIEVLEGDGVGASYRVGITTTNYDGLRASSCRDRLDEFTWHGRVGNQGEFSDVYAQEPGCLEPCSLREVPLVPTSTDRDSTPRVRPWLEKIGGRTNIGESIDISDALECVGPQGIGGHGFEAPLESMREVLLDSESGFLRDDALLAVIFVTDEEDCSMPLQYRTDIGAALPYTAALWSGGLRPSSAVCWRAGVTCEGAAPRYDRCYAEDHDFSGQPTTPGDAVLYPLDRYVDTLRGISRDKELRGGNGRVLIAVIAGVPEDYPESGQLVYEDSDFPEFNQEYGIGPGCGRGSETVGAPPGIPPVRLREVAEAFATEGRNIFSICSDDYSVALEQIAAAISELGSRACVPGCVLDTDPYIAGVQAECTVVEERAEADGGPRVVEGCVVANDGWEFPSLESELCYRSLSDQSQTTSGQQDDMSAQCITRGANLEFLVERREGASVAPGAAVRVDCELTIPDSNGQCPVGL